MKLNRLPIFAFFMLILVSFQIPPEPGRFFQTHSTWYEPIPSDAELMPGSEQYIDKLVERTAAKSLATSFRDYAVPIWRARVDTPLMEVPVSKQVSAEQGWNIVPIPEEAYPAGNDQRLEGEYRDGWMVVISHDGRWAWDFYQAVRHQDGRWAASYIRKWDLNKAGINQPYDNLGSAHVSPTPLLHGVIMLDEIKRGRITHAIGFATDSARRWSPGVYPCEGINSGRCVDDKCLQLGYRLQLDPSIDVTSLGLNQYGEIVAKALQEYGMIFIVNAGPGNTSVYAESLDHKNETWQGIIASLSGIPLDRFRVVQPIIPERKRPAAPENLRILGLFRNFWNRAVQSS